MRSLQLTQCHYGEDEDGRKADTSRVNIARCPATIALGGRYGTETLFSVRFRTSGAKGKFVEFAVA